MTVAHDVFNTCVHVFFFLFFQSDLAKVMTRHPAAALVLLLITRLHCSSSSSGTTDIAASFQPPSDLEFGFPRSQLQQREARRIDAYPSTNTSNATLSEEEFNDILTRYQDLHDWRDYCSIIGHSLMFSCINKGNLYTILIIIILKA